MRGELVIVRAYGNEPLVRRVWETTLEAVYIATEENYQRLLVRHQDAMNAAGFHREDVFVYEPDTAEKVLTDWENKRWWDSLTQWQGTAG